MNREILIQVMMSSFLESFFGVDTRGDDDWAFIGALAALSLDLIQVMGAYLINRIEPGRVIIQIGN